VDRHADRHDGAGDDQSCDHRNGKSRQHPPCRATRPGARSRKCCLLRGSAVFYGPAPARPDRRASVCPESQPHFGGQRGEAQRPGGRWPRSALLGGFATQLMSHPASTVMNTSASSDAHAWWGVAPAGYVNGPDDVRHVVCCSCLCDAVVRASDRKCHDGRGRYTGYGRNGGKCALDEASGSAVRCR
jgi:hypothetical protein